MFQVIVGVIIIYVIHETIKGDTKEVWQMIDEEYIEEKKLKEEWNELKEKYMKKISS